MAAHEPFRFHSLDELKGQIQRLGLDLPVDDDLSVLKRPVNLAGRVCPNAIAVHPMEGCDGTAAGAPDALTFRRYRRFAGGGAGLLWMEATAVVPEGRANPRQLWLHKGTVGTFGELVQMARDAAHRSMGSDHRPVLVVQLTHSGRYSRPEGKPAPIIAHHSEVLDVQHDLPPDYPVISDDELERLQDRYVEAARCAVEAGFDGVDIKSCHRYLVSELHASFTRDNSRFGGSFENRARFVLEVMDKVREAVRGEIFVTARLNVYDAIPYPYGFGVDRQDANKPDLAEPIRLIGLMRQRGAIPLVNVSIGNPYWNPHYGRPFDVPVDGGAIPDEPPLAGVARLVDIARQIQQAFTDLPVVGTGYSWLRHFFPNVAAGVLRRGWATMIGAGRMAFAYPEFARDVIRSGRIEPRRACLACSSCTQIMRDGGRAGCVVRDPDVYSPIYKQGRLKDPAVVRQLASRCRDCVDPTCVAGCPAGVDVPGFLRELAAGNDREAYRILRQTNFLPEICALICPAEVQCEGACVERCFTEPVPIRALQEYVAWRARQEGWTRAHDLEPATPTGRHVAVVGAGPAGLACAGRLLSAGHTVSILDRVDEPGGLLRRVIPPQRLPDDVAAAELQAVLESSARLSWRLGTALTPERNLDSLMGEGYDAVFLALGLMASTPLPGSDRPASGVIDALSFLQQCRQGDLAHVPRRVAVLGGGNVAMDAALGAHRAGAVDVYVLYRRSFAEMPAWPSERDAALAEGIHFLILTQPLGYQADADRRLTGVRVARTRLGEPDDDGRRRPEVVSGTEHVIEAELAIEAIGQKAEAELRGVLPGVTFDQGGLVAIDPQTHATTRRGVYAGGDLVNGGTTAAQAIAEGYRAATAIDAYLRGAPGAVPQVG